MKTIKTDITIHEQIVLPLEDRPVLQGYEQYRDLPTNACIRVYSLDEVAVEKTVAILDPARTEPRDLYDLWFLTSNNHVRLEELFDAIAKKLAFRGRTVAQVGGELLAKKARYERSWDIRLGPQMAELPEFKGVFRAVQRALRQAGVTAR